VYAIVRAGGRQEKVSVGDVLLIDKIGQAGDEIQLQPLLVVDGGTVTSDASKLAKVKVTAEVVNKTGYRRRQGHRQALTTLKVTAIDLGK